MSKYFAKYVLVEGEVKDGDYAINNAGQIRQVLLSNDETKKEQKVKLFLCSKGIEVGNKLVRYNHISKGAIWSVLKSRNDGKFKVDGLAGWYTLEELQKDCFKIIGEISPEATYVKEGDEFDKENVRQNFMGATEVYQIKGPCGHYH